MDFMQFLAQGWDDHRTDAGAVMARLPEGLTLAVTASDVGALAVLATHVAGEHLGRWSDGMTLLEEFARHPAVIGEAAPSRGPTSRQIARHIAALALCAGDHGTSLAWQAKGASGGAVPPASDRIRILAVAASALAGQKRTEEAATCLHEAVALAAYGPRADDPAARVLAINANNMAVALETLPARTPGERDLMILAAETARRFWEIAGTWLEVERAEYRLAMTMIAAGESSRAIDHAKRCFEGCEDNASSPYEAFYAREALARAYAAAGLAPMAQIERAKAAELIPFMKPEMQGECRDALARL